MKSFLKQIVKKTQTQFLKDYSRKEVSEYHYSGAMVETSKNFGVSGVVIDVEVQIILTDGVMPLRRYFRSFEDIRDFAVFHSQLMLCHKLDDLHLLITKFDFL